MSLWPRDKRALVACSLVAALLALPHAWRSARSKVETATDGSMGAGSSKQQQQAAMGAQAAPAAAAPARGSSAGAEKVGAGLLLT